MPVRAVEGKKPYTGGKAIEIDENKVINLKLRSENNLILYDEGDNEIYVDLQLPDELTPTDVFPVGITTGRVIVDNGWDWQGTIVCFKTTSGDNIKLLYADDGKLYIDNGTGTFKQIYLKGEVDALLLALRQYVDQQLALKQDKLIAGENIVIAADGKTISAMIPPLARFLSIWDCETGLPDSFPTAALPFEYITGDHYIVGTVDTTNTPPVNYRPSGTEYDGTASQTLETADVQPGDVYIYDGSQWLLQVNHDKVVTFAQIAGQPSDNQALAQALNSKLEYSSYVSPITLSTGAIYAGTYTDNATNDIYNLGILCDNIGFSINKNSGDRHSAFLEYFNGAADLYISELISNIPTSVFYCSNHIYSRGTANETFEFQGTGNNKIARLGDLLGKQDTLTSGQNITIDQNNEISVDYSWTTITILSGNATLTDTRCKLIPTGNFTLQAPSTVSEGQEYVLRCENTTVYTMTLGTGFTNPHNVDLTLSANATDQFVFLATPSGDLELQPAQLGAGTGINISNGNINNTGVLSVNGANGAVTVNDVKIGSTAPTPATAGMMWFNTTDNKLYSYDGSNWNVVGGATYSAGTGISINSNTITNTLPGAIKSSTAPSNPSQGDQWYDTTNDELKIYDGSAWNAVGGGGDVGISSQANNVFTPGMKIWGGTSANYANLTPDGNTAYLII